MGVQKALGSVGEEWVVCLPSLASVIFYSLSGASPVVLRKSRQFACGEMSLSLATEMVGACAPGGCVGFTLRGYLVGPRAASGWVTVTVWQKRPPD